MTERRGEILGNVAALVGVLVAMVVMFNQANGRPDCMQTESNRRFDQLLEALRIFEGRITVSRKRQASTPMPTE